MIVVACRSLNSIVQRCAAWKKSFPWDERDFHCGVWPGDKMCHNTKTRACKETVYTWVIPAEIMVSAYILAVCVVTELTSLTQFWPYSACFWPPHGSCLSRTPCSWQWADHQASGARPAQHKKTDQLLAIPKGLRILLDLWQSRSNLRLKHNFNKQQLSSYTYLATYIHVISHSRIHNARWFSLFPIWYSGLTCRILKNATLLK